MHTILKTIDYERGKIFGVLLGLVVALWVIGCQSTTPSIAGSGVQVTRTQLEQEATQKSADLLARRSLIESQARTLNSDIEAFNQAIETATQDLDRQDQFKVRIIETIGGIGLALADGTFNPASVIGSVTQLALVGLGVGAGIDHLRKNRVIAQLKQSPPVVTG